MDVLPCRRRNHPSVGVDLQDPAVGTGHRGDRQGPGLLVVEKGRTTSPVPLRPFFTGLRSHESPWTEGPGLRTPETTSAEPGSGVLRGGGRDWSTVVETKNSWRDSSPADTHTRTHTVSTPVPQTHQKCTDFTTPILPLSALFPDKNFTPTVRRLRSLSRLCRGGSPSAINLSFTVTLSTTVWGREKNQGQAGRVTCLG